MDPGDLGGSGRELRRWRHVEEVLVAHARGQRLADVRAGRVRTSRQATVRVEQLTSIVGRHVADAASVIERLRERTHVDSVIVLDADDSGCAEGHTLLAGWRSLAASYGIPCVLTVSGRAPGWADPQDAHIDTFRTHDSGPAGGFSRFIIRGVPPNARASDRLELVLVRDRGRAVLCRTPWRCTSDRERPRPAAEHDFDGTYHPRPTILREEQLAERLVRPDWRPADERERVLVIDALAAASVGRALGARSVLATIDEARLREVVAMSGGPVAWAVALIEAVQDDLHPALARLIVERGLRATDQLDDEP